MDGSVSPAPADLPAACSLDASDGSARMARWVAVGERAKPSAVRRGGTLEVRFAALRGVHDELQSLAAAEQQCCSFAEWTVVEDNDHIVLRVIAKPDSPDDIAPIAALFGAA